VDTVPGISTIYPLIILAIGLLFIVIDSKPDRLLAVVGYIAGAEVLWRMSDTGVFHEFGKYAVILLLLLAIVKWKRPLKFLPIAFFVLLTPSILLTLSKVSLGQARQEISANLSGPLALAIAVLFFMDYKLSWPQLYRILRWITFPIISMSIVILIKILRSEYIYFTLNSNFTTSGGYGPNQVSAILGLGALCSLIILFIVRSGKSKLIFSVLFLLFTGQAVLTFSRGGIVNLIVAAVPFLLIHYRNVFRNFGTFIFSILVVVVTFFILIPNLNVYTGGVLQQRYNDRDLTNRRNLVQGDLDAFLASPFVGVGPGMADEYYYKHIGISSASHTEYTRMLGEHGVLGILSLVTLVIILIRAFVSNQSSYSKTMVMTLAFWSLVEMTHSAMRIAAIALLVGISTAYFMLDVADEPPSDEE